MNSDCTIKICDFGMARVAPKRVSKSSNEYAMTVYVATRWYRYASSHFIDNCC